MWCSARVAAPPYPAHDPHDTAELPRPLIVQASLAFSNAILAAAALGFLGMAHSRRRRKGHNAPEPASSSCAPGGWHFPGLAILITVLAIKWSARPPRRADRSSSGAEAWRAGRAGHFAAIISSSSLSPAGLSLQPRTAWKEPGARQNPHVQTALYLLKSTQPSTVLADFDFHAANSGKDIRRSELRRSFHVMRAPYLSGAWLKSHPAERHDLAGRLILQEVLRIAYFVDDLKSDSYSRVPLCGKSRCIWNTGNEKRPSGWRRRRGRAPHSLRDEQSISSPGFGPNSRLRSARLRFISGVRESPTEDI